MTQWVKCHKVKVILDKVNSQVQVNNIKVLFNRYKHNKWL
jgi:hypothetical protein